MTVLVLTAVPAGLRGDLTRWLLEVAPGVFVGRISRRVRDHLWNRVLASIGTGSATMIVNAADREQGYRVLTAGQDRWVPVDVEGLTLIQRPCAVRGNAKEAAPVPKDESGSRDKG